MLAKGVAVKCKSKQPKQQTDNNTFQESADNRNSVSDTSITVMWSIIKTCTFVTNAIRNVMLKNVKPSEENEASVFSN